MEIEMKIQGLMMDPITSMPIIILKEACGSGILPIWVGVSEIVTPQYVEDLPDHFDLSRLAESKCLADSEIEPRKQTAVDLA